MTEDSQTVQEALQRPDKSQVGFWGFVNSSFGLWLLSAVFITGAGGAYTNWQNATRENAQRVEVERKEKARIKELTERLDLEISYRLSFAMARLEAANRHRDKRPVEEQIRNAVAPLTFPMSDATPPLFPEFKSYSGPALIAELRRHVPEEQQDRLKNKLASLTGLLATIDTGLNAKPYTPFSFAGELIEGLKDSRWNNGFFYTDCSRKMPFC